MNGYILESKTVLESDIWAMPPLYFKVWNYLLLKAQFQDHGNLKRGQLFTTINEIREACSYYVGYRKVLPTRKEIYGIIEWLRKPHERETETETKGTMIATTKVTHGIIVTICNYNKYQDKHNYESNGESNNEGTTNGNRKGNKGNNIIKEYKEINNKEKKKPSKEKEKIPPTVDEVKAYCTERDNGIDPEYFVDYYAARNWILTNGKKMQDWKAAVRTWEHRRKERENDNMGAVRKSGSGAKEVKHTSEEYERAWRG